MRSDPRRPGMSFDRMITVGYVAALALDLAFARRRRTLLAVLATAAYGAVVMSTSRPTESS